MENEWIDKSPFTAYKGKTKNVDRFYLNKEELAHIAGKEFLSERLKQVRDVFIFCCFTGLAYVDVFKLKQENIRKGIDGDRWIFTNRQKTKTRSSVPLLPTAVQIIDRYATSKVCLNKGLLLPVPSNQKMNEYLKEIANLCGIEKKLTIELIIYKKLKDMSGETNGLLVPDEIVMNKIYHIRGMKVMVDKDLAEIYEVQTRNLNKAVGRNLKRFPDEDFMFQLTDDEFKNLMFQNGTSSWGGTRKAPYVFTEQGVAMLSGILNSDRAIAVNIQIMRIFTRMRQMFVDNTEIRLEIEKIKNKLDNQDKNMEIVFRYLDELLEKQERPNPPRKRIGFKADDF